MDERLEEVLRELRRANHGHVAPGIARSSEGQG